jgi:cob(I)alamin adenosyltransferase
MYTKRGDDGNTDLKKGRVRKSTDIIKTIGKVDALTIFICDASRIIRPIHPEISRTLMTIVHKLYQLNGVLSGYVEYDPVLFDPVSLESYIQSLVLPPLSNFIIACQNEYSASVDKCRVIARDTEITLWRYAEDNDCDQKYIVVLQYMNRLSSYFFVIARYLNVTIDGNEMYLKDIMNNTIDISGN